MRIFPEVLYGQQLCGGSSLTNHFQRPQGITGSGIEGLNTLAYPGGQFRVMQLKEGLKTVPRRVLQDKNPVPLKGRNVEPEGFLVFYELQPKKNKGERTRKFTLQFFHQYFLFSLAALLSNCDAPICKASARSSSCDSISSLFRTLSIFSRMRSTT